MEINHWYVTGLVDGEGSFLASFSRRDKLTIGLEVRPSFTVSQHQRNQAVLQALQKFFGCGSIRFNTSDETYKYEVRSLGDLREKIIPHFEQYPLQTSKQKDFAALRQICELMRQNAHRSVSGMEQIVEVAYRMNNIGARRYHKTDLLQVMGKMKV